MMMESKEIQTILPHRYPFLLVDRLIELEPGKRGVGIKNVTRGEWFLSAGPEYPPALLLESLAQVGGIVLGTKAKEEDASVRFIGLFAGISDFEFQRPPVAGEQITLRMELSQSLASIYRFLAEASVRGEKIARGQILVSFSRIP